MSYILIPASTVSNPEQPYGVSLNFNQNGVFEKITSADLQGLENLKNLLLTFPGERSGDWINYGCNLKLLIFEQNTLDIKTQIQDVIVSAVSTWLGGYINIQSIDIITADDDSTMEYSIKVTIRFTVTSSRLEQQIEIGATETGVITII